MQHPLQLRLERDAMESIAESEQPPPNPDAGGVEASSSRPSEVAAGPEVTAAVTTNPGGGREGGGRTSVSGRGLVSTQDGPRGGGRASGGRGSSSNRPPPRTSMPYPPQQRQAMPVKIHANSGVPFGHVPAYLPGSSSLIEELDRRMMLVLRDGKHLIGTLASFDQFSNLVLLDAIERRIVTVRHSSDESAAVSAAPTSAFGNNVSHYFADIPLGMYIVRGDSLVVAGEVHNPDEGIDAQLSSSYPTPGMQRVSLEELQKLSTSELAEPPIEWDFDGDLIA